MRTSGVCDGSGELFGGEAGLHDSVGRVGSALRGDVDPFVEDDVRDGLTGDAQAEVLRDDSHMQAEHVVDLCAVHIDDRRDFV